MRFVTVITLLALFSVFAVVHSKEDNCDSGELDDCSGEPGDSHDDTNPDNSGNPSDSSEPDDNDGNSDSKSGSGEATYYEPGLGACGYQNDNTEYVAAINAVDGSDKAAFCGKKVCITYKGTEDGMDNGVKTRPGKVTVTLVDLCPGCAKGDIDLSHPAFLKLTGDLGPGRVQMSWQYC
ncbi:hypothetical protein H4219_003075 [Mycoemilia scoparia]|uniref:RlpA-like protein double-psi beta-barrel domain-containing protein n=1 Tax=Mycoemilia scoparia TaxID=417184 RepID=A0A9W8A578_9FUNG|nr:hypothetical protein H4219_003075 [Mycoemilia scoparia]